MELIYLKIHYPHRSHIQIVLIPVCTVEWESLEQSIVSGKDIIYIEYDSIQCLLFEKTQYL